MSGSSPLHAHPNKPQNLEMTEVAPHGSGDFVVQPTKTEEVDLDEMPEQKLRFGGARNSVQMMKVREFVERP